jgi:hypothetical protein
MSNVPQGGTAVPPKRAAKSRAAFDETTGRIVLDDEILREGFTQVPNLLLKAAKVPLTARCVLIMILHYAWQKDSAYPGQARLADDLGISERTIRTALQDLRDRRMVVVESRGFGLSRRYRVTRMSSWDLSGHTETGDLFLVPRAEEDETPAEFAGTSIPEDLAGMTGKDCRNDRQILPTKKTQIKTQEKKTDRFAADAADGIHPLLGLGTDPAQEDDPDTSRKTTRRPRAAEDSPPTPRAPWARKPGTAKGVEQLPAWAVAMAEHFAASKGYAKISDASRVRWGNGFEVTCADLDTAARKGFIDYMVSECDWQNWNFSSVTMFQAALDGYRNPQAAPRKRRSEVKERTFRSEAPALVSECLYCDQPVGTTHAPTCQRAGIVREEDRHG